MKVICSDCTLVYFNHQSGLSVIYRQGNAVMDESASKVTLASGKRESTFGRERVWKEEATTIQETLPKLSSQAPKPTWIQSKVHLRPRSWRTSRFCVSLGRLTSSRTLTGAKSKILPLFNLTTMELSCIGGGMVNLSSIVHSSLLNSALASSKSASTFSKAFGPSLAAPARTLFLT